MIPENSARGRWSWALYDWANSPFTTLVITFIFPAYFQAGIVKDAVAGQALWGYAIAASGLVIAIVAPVLGAIADAAGRRKPWILAFTAVCVAGSAALWFATPSQGSIRFALAAVIVANIGYEFGVVFNNAMLPDIVPEERLGRLSGWAWGLGYAGGLAALVVGARRFSSGQNRRFSGSIRHRRSRSGSPDRWSLSGSRSSRCRSSSSRPTGPRAARGSRRR